MFSSTKPICPTQGETFFPFQSISQDYTKKTKTLEVELKVWIVAKRWSQVATVTRESESADLYITGTAPEVMTTYHT